MNQNYFNIFKKYRKRKYERDLERLKNESRLKAAAFINEERRLKDDYEDEVGMEQEKMIEQKKERQDLHSERRISKIANVVLAIVAVSSFLGTVWFSSITIKNDKEANVISRLTAEQEYYNQQPFLIVIGGNDDATSVIVKNAGEGLAKDIFFLKHVETNVAEDFVLTREGDVALAMAKGGEGTFNLNTQYMDILSANEVLDRVSCISENFLLKVKGAWVIAFYKNALGDQFVSYIYGTDAAYSEAIKFEKLDCDK